MTRRALLLFAPMLVATLFVQQARSQAGAAGKVGGRVPVTIVLVNGALFSGQPWVIQRMPDRTPADRILLNSQADAEQLAEAVRALLVVRQADGDIPLRATTMRTRPEQSARRQRQPLPWISRVWTDLHRTDPREVQGMGNARSLQIWLPPQPRGPATRLRTGS